MVNQNTRISGDVDVLAATFGLEFGPRRDRESVLNLIEQVVARVERVLREMEMEDGEREERATEGQVAFERFMARLKAPIEAAHGRVSVKSNVAWIKIESRVNGHKVYISKGKFNVGRVDSTIPHELILGARRAPEGNGRIASWLPADEQTVAEAIELLGDDRMDPLQK